MVVKNISVGENEEILWIDFNGETANSTNIDSIINPLNKFWDLLEIDCLAACCGIYAFSFWPEDINKAKSNANIVNLHNLVLKSIESISEIESEILDSSRLNQLINRKVFINLLQHILAVISKVKS